MRKSVRTLFTALTLVFVMLFTALPVQAAKQNTPLFVQVYKSKPVFTFVSGDSNANNSYEIAFVEDSFGKTKITNLKSSNSSIATLKVSKCNFSTKTTNRYVQFITCTAKKPGTVTLSFKVNSKTYSVRATFKNKKYQNPVASIKVGNTTLGASKFKSCSSYTLKHKNFYNKKHKISITPAKGWQLTEMGYQVYYPGDVAASRAILKNNQVWKLTHSLKYTPFLTFYLKNKSTGSVQNICVCFK